MMGPKRIEPNRETYSGRCAIRLRKLRERAGLTIPAAAEKIGVSTKQLYNWESSTYEPKLDVLPAMAKAYGIKSPRFILAEK